MLSSYAYDEGPAYPKGRRKNESVSEFFRRLQAQELRKDCKDIFAPLRIEAPNVGEKRRKALATALLQKKSPRIDRRDPWTIYKEAMQAKAERVGCAARCAA